MDDERALEALCDANTAWFYDYYYGYQPIRNEEEYEQYIIEED